MAEHEYDLEERTFSFAKDVRVFIKTLPVTMGNKEDAKQLIRCSASIGANYIEANEALSKKDFPYRVKIARKEAKESTFFLRLLDLESKPELESTRETLRDESTQLMKILGAIVTKSSGSL
ncbi:four helix bundle protein [bacterium]|nr:four helix bundle protein [Akkermansiaceae bacterium]MDB4295967.1 four helix bundle protein [bacterium]MDB4378090.1 four helix bundle protein [Akkermansiaceae bacterium]MDB4388377.1 four helix bundle protein [Akkermansiaceae bacterium]MDB4452439.1 four helix bundle protein [Akkermansiaceae bacterium]